MIQSPGHQPDNTPPCRYTETGTVDSVHHQTQCGATEPVVGIYRETDRSAHSTNTYISVYNAFTFGMFSSYGGTDCLVMLIDESYGIISPHWTGVPTAACPTSTPSQSTPAGVPSRRHLPHHFLRKPDRTDSSHDPSATITCRVTRPRITRLRVTRPRARLECRSAVARRWRRAAGVICQQYLVCVPLLALQLVPGGGRVSVAPSVHLRSWRHLCYFLQFRFTFTLLFYTNYFNWMTLIQPEIYILDLVVTIIVFIN